LSSCGGRNGGPCCDVDAADAVPFDVAVDEV
jgi:hypothetical protein